MQAWRWPIMVTGYVCYALVLFALFVYVKFPGQQVRGMVLTALSRHGLNQIHIESVTPIFPPGIALRHVSFGHEANGRPVELVRISELRTYLRTLVPFGHLLRVRFEGELYGGNLLGEVVWERTGESPVVEVSANVQDVRLDALPLGDRVGNMKLGGKLVGNMTLRMTSPRWEEGEGRLVFRGDAGGLPAVEVMGVKFPALAYEQFGGELALQTRTVVISDVRALGRDWQLDVRGRVGLTKNLSQSTLDLTLRARVSEALEQQLGLVGTFLKQRRDRRGFASFRIGGTLSNPKFIL